MARNEFVSIVLANQADASLAADLHEAKKGGARIRIDRIREIAATVGDIRKAIVGVKNELREVKLKKLPRRLRPRVEKGIEQAEETDEILQQAEAGLAILPRFLGADEPRTYLFGMQNSAEQRGTGGAMLQFALLSIDGGHPRLNKASTVYDVDENRDPISGAPGAHPVGTGPFRLKQWRRASRIVLERSPTFRGVRYEGVPADEEAAGKVISDFFTAFGKAEFDTTVALMENGEDYRARFLHCENLTTAFDKFCGAVA